IETSHGTRGRRREGVFGIRQAAELGQIEAFELDFLRDAHAPDGIHDFEHRERNAKGPSDVYCGPKQLNFELSEIAVEQTGHALAGFAQVFAGAHAVPSGAIFASCEETDAQTAEGSAITVHRNCAAGIVDFKDTLVEEHAAANDNAGYNSDDDRPVGVH